MWKKTYFATLAIFAAILAFFMYYAWSWLASIGAPADAFAGYEFWSSLGWVGLWIATVILLFNANIVFAKTEEPWAFSATFAFFAVFVVAKFFWLGSAAIDFQQANNLPSGSAFLGPFLAIFLCTGFAGVVFVNHYVAERFRAKIYPAPPVSDSPNIDIAAK